MGIPARYEPPNMRELRRNAEFFQRLNGFHCEAALQFTLNLIETHSEVWGLRIEVSEAIVAKVTSLP